jgi:hypothetical protein
MDIGYSLYIYTYVSGGTQNGLHITNSNKLENTTISHILYATRAKNLVPLNLLPIGFGVHVYI